MDIESQRAIKADESQIEKTQLYRLLQTLDELDKHYSEKLHELQSPAVETVLIVFAHVFNRFYFLISLLVCFVAATCRCDTMLAKLGYQTLASNS